MRRGISLLLVLTLIILTFACLNSITENDIQNNTNLFEKYVKHPVIRINSDEEFALVAQAEGWQGNGSAENPYIIENYSIDAHGAGNCIYIGNTTVHFILRNLYLYNASYISFSYFNGCGIYLYNVKNAVIENVISTKNERVGIYLRYSNYNIIKNISSTENLHGIRLWNSSHNIVKNNTISNNTYIGIYLWASNYNVIKYNTIANQSFYGIDIDSGSYNLIYCNFFYYNHGSGNTYNSSYVQARDFGTNNRWNSTNGKGNYWHDWANNNDTNDQNNDGIVDWPYILDGTARARDYYPLITPNAVQEMPDVRIMLWSVLISALLLVILRKL